MHILSHIAVTGVKTLMSCVENMKTVKPNFAVSAVLLLLLLGLDRCSSLTDDTLPAIFYPFGSDEGDFTARLGNDNCGASISMPYKIFNYNILYVSL